eukprot:CAMPEP_0196652276 /NCGR_PEP_ID=MMETSP1086-20130531/1514_1 /TAXON_ID=77921 /ORGANISM="Cyanoptyche  gloeocystis , Strain SAG4.97" /LENGTH=371 /DNA_ID=CAMNT_0041982723 /DNA_START=305 /DNA_END=1420 /DNA_ORIENTATION=+
MKKYKACLGPLFDIWTENSLKAAKDFGATILCGIPGVVPSLWAISDLLHIPHMVAAFVPTNGTGAFPATHFFGEYRFRFGMFNRASWKAMYRIYWHGLLKDITYDLRQKFGLPPVKDFAVFKKRLFKEPLAYLYPVPQCLLPKPSDWPENATVTGALPQASLATPATQEVTDFVEGATTPLIYIGFGSMTDTLSEDNLRCFFDQVFQCTSLLPQHRFVIQLGNSKRQFFAPPGPNVLLVDLVPHNWLFPKCDLIISHGGVGTLASILTAGKPSLSIPIDPIPTDQKFWGRCIEDLGAGKCLYGGFRKVTGPSLAAAIESALADQAMKAKAVEHQEKIVKEDGVGAAVEAMVEVGRKAEEWLNSRRDTGWQL